MKRKEFIETFDKLEPSEELINKTIRKVKEIKEEKGGIKMKGNVLKFVRNFSVGVAAMLILSVTSFACYVGITGNTEILEKIGINLSKNYTDNSEEIDSSVQYNENSEIKIKSAAIDKAYLVIEYELKLANNVQCEDPQIDSSVSFFDTNAEKYAKMIGETSQVSKKQEDGSFIIYQVLIPTEIEGATTGDGVIDEGEIRAYEHDLISHVFDATYRYIGEEWTLVNVSETAKFSVDLLSIKDENGNIIEDIKKSGAFEFELHENDKVKNDKSIDLGDVMDRNFEVSRWMEESPFVTVITVMVTEVDKNGEYVEAYIEKDTKNLVRRTTTGEEMNPFANPYDIEKVDIVVKDQNGREIKELFSYEYFDALVEANHFFKVIILDKENEDIIDYKVELIHTQEKQRDVYYEVPYSD